MNRGIIARMKVEQVQQKTAVIIFDFMLWIQYIVMLKENAEVI